MERAAILRPLRRNHAKRLDQWEQRDFDRLLDLLEQGWTDAEIGHLLRMKAGQIFRARRAKGWPPGPEMAGCMTASQVGDLMGFSTRSSTPRRWIRKGWLQATVRHRPGAGKPNIFVRQQWLFDFMENPEHLHRWHWEPIRDPVIREYGRRLREGKVFSLGEAAEMIGVEEGTVRSWVLRHQVPVLKDGTKNRQFLRRDQVDLLKQRYVWGDGVRDIVEELAG